MPPHKANPCSGPAQHVPMGMVLPSAEMLSQPSLYLSFSATCALRRGTQSWARLPYGALHPPTPLAAAAQHLGAGGLGQPSPHVCGVSESTLPGPCRLCSGCISYPSCRAMVLSPLESISREGRGLGLAAQHCGGWGHFRAFNWKHPGTFFCHASHFSTVPVGSCQM